MGTVGDNIIYPLMQLRPTYDIPGYAIGGCPSPLVPKYYLSVWRLRSNYVELAKLAHSGKLFWGMASDTQQCIQILGDRPWTGQRAIVWDCQKDASDEHVDRLPTSVAGSTKLKIDMSSDGGGPLCMAVRADVAPPPPPPSCNGIDALRFNVVEAASSAPTGLRHFAVY